MVNEINNTSFAGIMFYDKHQLALTLGLSKQLAMVSNEDKQEVLERWKSALAQMKTSLKSPNSIHKIKILEKIPLAENIIAMLETIVPSKTPEEYVQRCKVEKENEARLRIRNQTGSLRLVLN